MASECRVNVLQFEAADASVDLSHPDIDCVRSCVREKLLQILHAIGTEESS